MINKWRTEKREEVHKMDQDEVTEEDPKQNQVFFLY